MKFLPPLIFAAFFSTGCFVFDEIEKGREILSAHQPDSEDSIEIEKGSGDSAAKSPRQRLAEYYAKQRARASKRTASKDPTDAVGTCRIGKRTHFTRRSDCDLRGGTFL